MAQRINPNILKLNISKGTFNNSHSPSPYQFLHEDLYLRNLIEGFYFIFNLYTSEIVINRRQIDDVHLKFLLLDFNHSHRPYASTKVPRIQKEHDYFLKLSKFENLFLNSSASTVRFDKHTDTVGSDSGSSVVDRLGSDYFFELQFFNLHLGISPFNSIDRVLWNSFNINKFKSSNINSYYSSLRSTEGHLSLPSRSLVEDKPVPTVGLNGSTLPTGGEKTNILDDTGCSSWSTKSTFLNSIEKKALSQPLVLKHLQVSYINFTKLIYIYFLSHYLSQFLTNFVNNARITVDARLNYTLEKNINIFGKHLSKQLIYNPRKFKALFKQYHD